MDRPSRTKSARPLNKRKKLAAPGHYNATKKNHPSDPIYEHAAVGVARDLKNSPWQAKCDLAVVAHPTEVGDNLMLLKMRRSQLHCFWHAREGLEPSIAVSIVYLMLSEVKLDRRPARCGQAGNLRARVSQVSGCAM